MTDTTATQTKLANQFASVENTDALTKTFKDLNETIYAKAKIVSEGLTSLKRKLEDLMPYLGEMQSFLSQRGNAHDDFRNADLPTWTAWFAEFKKKTGLRVSIRAVQKQLAKLRGTKPVQKPEPPVKLSQKDQRRLLSAQHCANDMVAAMEHGADYSSAMQEFKRVAMGSDRIAVLLEGISEDADAPPSATSQVRELSAESRTMASAAPTVASSKRLLALPKSGSWLDLANNVIALCGEHFNGALGGLDPHDAARVFGKVAQRLAQTYCRYSDGGAMEMNVLATYVGARPPKAATGGQPALTEAKVRSAT